MFFLLPYGNDRPKSRFPAVTYALIAVNVLAYVWAMSVDRESAIGAMGLIPSQPSVGDILTSMFVHADIFHLGWNMLFLWLFGPNVEDALGRLEYAIFYFGSGFAAALMHLIVVRTFIPITGDIPMIGASGAIAGILGIFAIRFYKTGIKIWYFIFLIFIVRWGKFVIPAWIGLGIWFLQQFAGGLGGIIDPESGDVAYWSHIGGMLFGMILAYALRLGVEGKKEYLMADARADMERGTTWSAAENMRAVLDRDHDNPEVHGELASAYAIQQDEEKAVQHYKRSIELYLRKGEREKAVARYAEMKHHYRHAGLELKSEYQLARYMAETGYHAPALQLMQEIAFTHPGAPEAEVCLMKAGDLCLNTFNDPQNALNCYMRFLQEYPHSAYRNIVERSAAQAKEKLQA